MTGSEFKNELKKPCGAYLFCGEEDYLKKHYLNALRKELVSEGDVFNHIIINSENYSENTLFSALEALPVMADRKLIEVNSLCFSGMSESELEGFLSVVQRIDEYEYNVLVVYTEPDELDIGTKKQRSKEFLTLSKYLKPVIFDKESESKLASWANKHFVKELILAPADAVSLLVKRCGNDMYMLSGEINKLCCYLKANGRDKLTLEDVLNVSCERKEIEAFDFANAILEGSASKAFSVLGEMKKRREKPEIILSGISRVVGDLTVIKTLLDSGYNLSDVEKALNLHSYKVSLYAKSASRTPLSTLKKINEDCYKADISIKSSSNNSYTVLERLVYEALKR